jgi:FlaA1/EpsC-like NDP-sugar epimerase
MVDGDIRLKDIRNVRVEDMLGREKVELNMDAISVRQGRGSS